jgi:hypothetical protein
MWAEADDLAPVSPNVGPPQMAEVQPQSQDWEAVTKMSQISLSVIEFTGIAIAVLGGLGAVVIAVFQSRKAALLQMGCVILWR